MTGHCLALAGQYKAVACHITDLLDVVLSVAICGQVYTIHHYLHISMLSVSD